MFHVELLPQSDYDTISIGKLFFLKIFPESGLLKNELHHWLFCVLDVKCSEFVWSPHTALWIVLLAQDSKTWVETNFTAGFSSSCRFTARVWHCGCIIVRPLDLSPLPPPTFVYVPENRCGLRNSRIVFSSSSNKGVRSVTQRFLCVSEVKVWLTDLPGRGAIKAALNLSCEGVGRNIIVTNIWLDCELAADGVPVLDLVATDGTEKLSLGFQSWK